MYVGSPPKKSLVEGPILLLGDSWKALCRDTLKGLMLLVEVDTFSAFEVVD